MPKYNLELFKILILNFAYLRSKQGEKCMFTLYQKHQFISPLIRQFLSFSIFGKKAQEDLKIYFRGKILERNIANQSYTPNTPLTEVLNSLSSYFP